MNQHSLTKTALSQFTGSENTYFHPLFRYRYTEGIRYVAQEGGAWWLLDAIHSWQPTVLAKDAALHQFQLWTLKVNEDQSATLACQADSGRPRVACQKIGYTDFPLKLLRLYVIDHLMLLPSEY